MVSGRETTEFFSKAECRRTNVRQSKAFGKALEKHGDFISSSKENGENLPRYTPFSFVLPFKGVKTEFIDAEKLRVPLGAFLFYPYVDLVLVGRFEDRLEFRGERLIDVVVERDAVFDVTVSLSETAMPFCVVNVNIVKLAFYSI